MSVLRSKNQESTRIFAGFRHQSSFFALLFRLRKFTCLKTEIQAFLTISFSDCERFVYF